MAHGRLVDATGRTSGESAPAIPRAGSGKAISLPLLCLAGAALFTAYHIWLVYLMRNTGLQLGVVAPGSKVYRLVPLYMYWRLHLKTGLLIALAAYGAFWWWFQRTRAATSRPAFAVAGLMFFHAALACGVAMIDGGLDRLWRPYALMADSDYIGAVPHISTASTFLRDFTALIPQLPMHCQTHPPGGPLFLWMVGRLFGPGPMPAALATIAVGTLAVPAVYGLAREVLSQGRALAATSFFILAPCILLFTATCMDIVFAVPMICTMFFLWRARRTRPVLWGIAGGLAASLAAMFTFSAAFLAIWGLAVLLLTALSDRPQLPRTLLAGGAAAAAALVFYLVLYLATSYHLLETLAACTRSHHRIMDGGNHATWRQHGHLAVANLVAFFFCAGLPLAVLWLRHTWNDLRASAVSRDAAWLLSMSFVAALAVLDLAPIHTLEVEHIWLYMVPLVAIAAVRCLASQGEEAERRQGRAAIVILFVQTVAMEVCLTTLW